MNFCPMAPKSLGKREISLYIMSENFCNSLDNSLRHFAKIYYNADLLA